jgi:hypothetical protein
MASAEDPMLEGHTTLGYIAGLTDTMRLGFLVTGVTYRHPGLLAKIIANLDVLSGGRAMLGIGAAWYEREHVGLGVPFPHWRALRATRGNAPDLPPNVERRRRPVPGPLLPPRGNHLPDVGGDPAEIERTINRGGDPIHDRDGFLWRMERFAELGITRIGFAPGGPDPAAEVAQVCETVLPRLRTF